MSPSRPAPNLLLVDIRIDLGHMKARGLVQDVARIPQRQLEQLPYLRDFLIAVEQQIRHTGAVH